MANTKIPSELIADSAITAAKLADGTITTADIADSNVTTAKIADSNVTTAKIGDAQVTTAKIVDANVTTAKIADDAVTTAKMASNSVTSDTIASGITLAGTTTLSSHLVIGDNNIIKVGDSSDLQIYHDGNNSNYIKSTTSDIYLRNEGDNDKIYIQATNSSTLANYLTIDGNAGLTKFNKNTRHLDNVEATFGDSGDAGIYHNGTHLYIDEKDAGRIFIRSSDEIRLNKYTGEYMVRAIADGAVTLYHNNSPKLATTSTGIDVTGTATMDGLTVDGIVEIGSIETSTNFPLAIKSGTNDHAISIEEASGAESWQFGVNVNGDLGFYNSGSTTASVTFDDAGNVGIGSNNPDANLHISSAGGTELHLQEETSGQAAQIKFTNPQNSFVVGADANPQIFFINTDGNQGSGLCIDTSHKVGIGTDNPSTKLTIRNDSASTSFGDNNLITIQNLNTTDNARMGLAFTGNTGIGSGLAIIEGVSYDQSHGHTSINFSVYNGSWHNDMMVLKGGNVGIGGTPDASGRLLVTNGGTNQIVLKGASGTTNLNMGNFVGGGYISNNYYYSSGHQADDTSKGAFEVFIGDDNYGINYHAAGAAGTRRRDFAITSAGNTGIGTNSPSQFLDVRGHTSIGDGGGAVLLNFNATSNGQLKLNNVEKLRIDNYGQVTLYGDGAGHAYLVPQDQGLGYTNNLNAGAFGILHRASYDSYVTGNTYYYRTGGSSGWRAKYGAYKSTVMGMVNGAFTFDCSSAAPGSNGASVSGLAARVRIDSDGLKFGSDTAAANALDDYEEGTWTPACGATLSTAVGKYTKIGNQVTVYYHLVTTGGLPTSTSQVIITGLPFTSNSGSLVAAPIYSRYYTPNDSSLTSLVQDNESQIRLMNINDQSFDYTIWGELEASHNNSVYMIGSATYMV